MNKNVAAEIIDDKLVLTYAPYYGTGFIDNALTDGDTEILFFHRCVTVGERDIIILNDEMVTFSIADLEGDYYRIKTSVFSLKHSFYFHRNISFSIEMFLYSYNSVKESILHVIDNYIDSDFYVEVDIDKCINVNHVPIDTYLKLIDLFPKKAEIQKYLGHRINYIVEEYIKGAEERVKAYEDYIEQKNDKLKLLRKAGNLSIKDEFDALFELKINVLKTTEEWLIYALEHVDELDEQDFQERILLVVLSLFPKYIFSIREVMIEGMDKYDKIPDFLLIDSYGAIDVLEIKKPDKDILRKRMYRNNYAPSHELSGAALQVEKYIVCMQRDAISIEKNPPEKIKNKIGDKKLHVINPRGMIIMGRSHNLEEQQRSDLEIIRRHYMHIADIITYDDLLERINSIINSYTSNYE